MIKFIKLSKYKDKKNYNDYMKFINDLRSNYLWGQKTYSKKNIDNVYLISNVEKCVGFIELEYKELELGMCSQRSIYIYLWEIHILPCMQNKSIGKNVILQLLMKGVNIEMVVVHKNTNMLKLIKKFEVEEKYTNKNMKTVIIKPNKL